MTRDCRDFYSYKLQIEDEGEMPVIAVYFSTKTGTEYRVYFYPVDDYFPDRAYFG